jgi:antibiotic biosynthesis monooxygenase (ABM) superfamily enzyme
MIDHIVLLKVEGNADRVLDALKKVSALAGKVPGLASVSVGFDSSERTKSYSHCFVLRFEDAESLLAWGAHSLHQPIRETLMSETAQIVFDLDVN